MLNHFGRYLRKLRIDYGELIKDMAGKLGVTASYLSAVETGKRNIPLDWTEKIAKLYQLDNNQKGELSDAAARSATCIKLDLGRLKDSQRETAILFAREFNDLDESTMSKIRDLLKTGTRED